MNYVDDSQLPKMTPEEFGAIRATIRPFVLCILKMGPKFEMPGPDPSAGGVTAILHAHGMRNMALHRAGFMPIVAPVADGGEMIGMSMFDTSMEDAKRIMDGDPAVQANVVSYELHPCRSIPGSTLSAT